MLVLSPTGTILLGCLQDLVSTTVVFNRALYAQLALQQFQPPGGYPLPAPTHPAFKAAELGMKLTCGFEMVLARRLQGAQQLATGAELAPTGMTQAKQSYCVLHQHVRDAMLVGNSSTLTQAVDARDN